MKGFGYNILADKQARPNARSNCSCIKLAAPKKYVKTPKPKQPRLAITLPGQQPKHRRIP